MVFYMQDFHLLDVFTIFNLISLQSRLKEHGVELDEENEEVEEEESEEEDSEESDALPNGEADANQKENSEKTPERTESPRGEVELEAELEID